MEPFTYSDWEHKNGSSYTKICVQVETPLKDHPDEIETTQMSSRPPLFIKDQFQKPSPGSKHQLTN